ncbi:MAG: sporulation protein YqfD [Clostridia bacterium]|nr:sporulation protein YqfD [Clostridia bacterium]
MFLLNFLRLFTGYVRFRACGGFGERFLNLCSQKGIVLWDVETLNDGIYASTSVEGYKKIRTAAKNSGMTARIIKKYGLPFLVFKYRKRIGIPIGIVIFILCLSFLSTRIWLIDVEGNNRIPEEYIISAVEDAGLRIGCSVFTADPVKAALVAGNNTEGISDIKINIIGSRATIRIKEQEPSPEIVNTTGLYNVVANKDAQLVLLEPYCGTPIAKVLNTVLKGEVLISGVVANKDESTHYSHASGYAVGRTETAIKSAVNSDEIFHKIESNKRRYTLSFLSIEIPIGKGESNSTFLLRKEKFLSFSNKKMPLGILCDEYSSVTKNKASLSEKQMELIAIERYVNEAENYTENRQLISEKCSEKFGGNQKEIHGIFSCYENIGKEESFSINETGSSFQ